jgi:hypothetical protein
LKLISELQRHSHIREDGTLLLLRLLFLKTELALVYSFKQTFLTGESIESICGNSKVGEKLKKLERKFEILKKSCEHCASSAANRLSKECVQ